MTIRYGKNIKNHLLVHLTKNSHGINLAHREI